jgi:hypothetical protein
MGSWNQCVALLREAENDRYCKLPNAKSFRRLPAATATFSRNTTYRLQPIVVEESSHAETTGNFAKNVNRQSIRSLCCGNVT